MSRRSNFVAVALAVAGLLATSNPAAGQTTSIKRVMEGEQLFRTYCASCHGIDGKGGGPVAPALKQRPADVTAIAMRNHGVFPRDRIIRYVAFGDPAPSAHGSKDMPVWGPNFMALAPGSFATVNERVESVVAYLASIQSRK